MNSSLERIITLIETGINSESKLLAAERVGDIAKCLKKDNEFKFILQKIIPLLHSTKSDTRVAASKAIGNVMKNIPEYNPISVLTAGSGQKKIDQVHQEKIKYYEKLHGLKCDDILGKNEILLKSYSSLKRKRQLNNDTNNQESKIQKVGEEKDDSSVYTVKYKTESERKKEKEIKLVYDEWNFIDITNDLLSDLFHPVWINRHGSSMGLLEILRTHLCDLGKSVYYNDEFDLIQQNKNYLENVCVKVLKVLCLDRFNEYIGDKVISPVREICAEILGLLIEGLEVKSIYTLIGILTQMSTSKEWELRHSAVLGISFILKKRVTALSERVMAENIIPILVRRLKDNYNEIVCLAAESLIPHATFIVRKYNVIYVQSSVYEVLWGKLDDKNQDMGINDVSEIFKLLGIFYVVCGKADYASGKDKKGHAVFNLFFGRHIFPLLTRVWKFFRHNLTEVRLACLGMMEKLIQFSKYSKWLNEKNLLVNTIQYLYQNVVLESNQEVVRYTMKVSQSLFCNIDIKFYATYAVKNNVIGNWVNILQGNLLEKFPKKLLMKYLKFPSSSEEDDMNIRIEFNESGEYFSMLQSATKFISLLYKYCKNLGNIEQTFGVLIEQLFDSRFALHHQIACLIIENIFEANHGMISMGIMETLTRQFPVISELQQHNSPTKFVPVYCEVNEYHKDFIEIVSRLIRIFIHYEIDMREFFKRNSRITVENCQSEISGKYLPVFLEKLQKVKLDNSVEIKKEISILTKELDGKFSTFTKEWRITHYNVMCLLITCLVKMNMFEVIRKNINDVVRSLNHCIKYGNEVIQNKACFSMAILIRMFNSGGMKEQKIRDNLCNIVQDVLYKYRPKVVTIEGTLQGEEDKEKERRKKIKKLGSDASKMLSLMGKIEENEKEKEGRIMYKGAKTTIKFMTRIYGHDFFKMAPLFLERSYGYIFGGNGGKEKGKNEIDKKGRSYFLLSKLVPYIAVSSDEDKKNLLALIKDCIASLKRTDIQEIGAYLISSIVKRIFEDDNLGMKEDCIKILVKDLIGIVKKDAERKEDVVELEGAIFATYLIITRLELKILDYLILFVIPLVKKMSCLFERARKLATYSFAYVMKILPLDQIKEKSQDEKDVRMDMENGNIAEIHGIGGQNGMKESKVHIKKSEELEKMKMEERKFFERLLDINKLEKVEISDDILRKDIKLRPYQITGISWMWFLKEFKLNGILCDDMGLGKTLQSICIIAKGVYNKRKKNEKNFPSLIVCPGTLIEHWYSEFKFFTEFVKCLKYSGSSIDRRKKINLFTSKDVILTSYNIIRNDFQHFKEFMFNYVILDEGHLIKNHKSKISISVKNLNCKHRLILSGTPIQNNVLELWSLFDFLMPGFLGTRKEFNRDYSKKILKSRKAKANSFDKQEGIVALQNLHKQVLPFILRRLKEDVLDDLPPKIIQDYYCFLNSTQENIMIRFNNRIKGIKNDSFTKMEFLRKLCNHPRLVLDDLDPVLDGNIYKEVENMKLTDYLHSPKFISLKQLLNDCGIGGDENEENPNLSGRRALLFTQSRDTSDLIISCLLQQQFKNVKYLRLDSTVPEDKRVGLANTFNNDPSIEILVATKKIGGIGLNLTGADIVIFIEHDWNPTIDKQAMDRAHRIGQKKTVNVYRLITKNTIEEKIMGLQEFKKHLADSIINDDNVGGKGGDVLGRFEKKIMDVDEEDDDDPLFDMNL